MGGAGVDRGGECAAERGRSRESWGAVKEVGERLRGRGVRVQELASIARVSTRRTRWSRWWKRFSAAGRGSWGMSEGRVTRRFRERDGRERCGEREMGEAGYWRRQGAGSGAVPPGDGKVVREAGHRVYVEIGPGTTLLGLGRQCRGGKPGVIGWHRCGEGRGNGGRCWRAWSGLYERGAEVDWAGFDQPYDRRRVSLPTARVRAPAVLDGCPGLRRIR